MGYLCLFLYMLMQEVDLLQVGIFKKNCNIVVFTVAMTKKACVTLRKYTIFLVKSKLSLFL